VLCLTVEGREYQLDVGNATLSGDGSVVDLVLESSADDSLPRLQVRYPAAAMMVGCDDPDTSILIEFSGASLSSHVDGVSEGCSFSVGGVSPGATVSGWLTAVMQSPTGTQDVHAAWVEIPVAD
jgi:hypothetical protein